MSMVGLCLVRHLLQENLFAADFEVKPVINSQMKKIEGEAELDGLATLTFQFGI
ncbi:hypothetical protein IC611_01655 [Proteus mirabilis]